MEPNLIAEMLTKEHPYFGPQAMETWKPCTPYDKQVATSRLWIVTALELYTAQLVMDTTRCARIYSQVCRWGRTMADGGGSDKND
ncbi:unnamed protein product [Cylicostephanus goldi]|uniref:Uncharacterized protein n=1 Tax=Cylicostephanus goldi TaxID=71465 RepID=A0A3P6UIL8_CYLGO|nr:unnamed protein product [Cylicostephanus goldi]